MPINPSEVRTDVDEVLSNGAPVRFRYFNVSGADSGYDDDVTLTQSGSDFWTSGLWQPITTRDARYSQEAVLMEQGRLKEGDIKVYVQGSVDVSGLWRLGIGSANPPSEEYSIVDGGIKTWKLQDSAIYHTLYVRLLTTGSLLGE